MERSPATIKAACELAGVSYRQAHIYMTDGRLPRYEPGVTNFAHWASTLRKIQASAGNKPRPLAEGEENHRAIWERERATKLRLANEKTRGELVDRRAVMLAVARITTMVRDAIEMIPARIAEDLAAESDAFEVRSVLEREIHDALQHLSVLDSEEVLR